MLVITLVLAFGCAVASAQITNEDPARDNWLSLHSLLDQVDDKTHLDTRILKDEESRDEIDNEDVLGRWKRAFIDEPSETNIIFPQEDDETSSQNKQKRFFSIFRSRPPKSEGYKRGPGFRSWGGKRSDEGLEKREPEFSMSYQQLDKREKAQGGKRRFKSWGGKRAYSYTKPNDSSRNLWKNHIGNTEGKRKFSSWGGKRSEDLVNIEDLRHSWDG